MVLATLVMVARLKRFFVAKYRVIFARDLASEGFLGLFYFYNIAYNEYL